MNIIILTGKDKIDNHQYLLTDQRYLHIRDILKLERNDSLEIGILNGELGNAVVENINEERVILTIKEYYPVKKTTNQIEIVCALPRPQTLKKVLNISAAMGVSEISLVKAEKVEKSYFQSPLLKENNYTKFLIDGLSQGKLTTLPKVTINRRFKEFIKNKFPKKESICILTNPGSRYYLSKLNDINNNLVIAIGPEAGWNQYEINFMKEAGFKEFKLSEKILRVENALVAVLSQIELLRFGQ